MLLEVFPNRAPLAPTSFTALPLGAVRPLGWLLQQLRTQADGLTGHIDEFWPDLGPDSGWLGGTGESWERGPYYLDGLVPLAYLLEDEGLLAKARRWLDWVLESQHDDGWLGPTRDPRGGAFRQFDAWPVTVILKALTQYQEASGDERVIPGMRRFFTFLAAHLDEYPLHSWGLFRWGDLLLSVAWLFNRTRDQGLLDLAARLHEQGYDWTQHFRDFRLTEKTAGKFDLATHVVNNAMGVKTPGIWFQFSYDPADRQAVYDALANLDCFHGQATGVFSGDEHLAGPDPSQGTELCAVVELMYSLEAVLPVLADAALADRLERIAYNALPATFTPDMWAHQYDQQANQVLCSVAPRQWTNNFDDSNTFGLEPNFGCCTANMHQGWPKFAASLWMATAKGGLAATAYGPCRVDAVLAGQRVAITEETDYPFDGTVRLRIECRRPISFPVTLRIPHWCKSPSLRLPDGSVEGELEPGWHTVQREWRSGDELVLELPMSVRAERRYHGSVALHRGPLVLALKVTEAWRQIGGDLPHADWEVSPTSPWNYGLLVDPEDPERSLSVERRPVGEVPFAPEGAPLSVGARGRRLPEWQLERNSAGPLPQSPVFSDEPLEDLTLIPYGAARLRVAEFPLLAG